MVKEITVNNKSKEGLNEQERHLRDVLRYDYTFTRKIKDQ